MTNDTNLDMKVGQTKHIVNIRRMCMYYKVYYSPYYIIYYSKNQIKMKISI